MSAKVYFLQLKKNLIYWLWLESLDTIHFQPFFTLNLWMLFSTHRRKINLSNLFLLFCCNFQEIIWKSWDHTTFSFWCFCSLVVQKIHLHLCYLHKKFCSHYSKQEANQVHSIKFEKVGMVTFLLNMTTYVTYEKYATRSLDVVVILIIGVF